jgi:hypothetical protein
MGIFQFFDNMTEIFNNLDIDSDEVWKKCSVCKSEIGFEEPYLQCTVSTCSRPGRESVFCSVPCWDAHVPIMNHKDAGFRKFVSPKEKAEKLMKVEKNNVMNNVIKKNGVKTMDTTTNKTTTENTHNDTAPKPVLVVVSKLKEYISDTSGMNTSGTVPEVVSRYVREICDKAVANAAADGRKTVMDRDFANV